MGNKGKKENQIKIVEVDEGLKLRNGKVDTT